MKLPLRLALAALATTSLALAQNNECSGALPLPMGTTAFDTTGATTSSPPFSCGSGGSDIWYVFTAPTSDTFRISACSGTTFDSVLQVYSGACGALQPVICNNDACGLQSWVVFTANAGDQRYLRVGGAGGATGSGTLRVTEDFPVFNPANGHYYEIVQTNVDWNTAEQMAAAMVYQGMAGHLVTIADAAEDAFVYTTLSGAALGNAWLGGYQDMNAASYSEPSGGWTWVTGEPFSYVNWTAGEPNDGGGSEHFLGYWPADEWNDYALFSANVGRFVVEYEGGSLGTSYCDPAAVNSTGAFGKLSAGGSATAADNLFVLTAFDLPQSQFGYFIAGRTQGFIPQPGGSQGNLCITIPLARVIASLASSGAGGQLVHQLDLTAIPLSPPVAVVAGDTWNFQAWYRDVNPNATSNFTTARAVTFQ